MMKKALIALALAGVFGVPIANAEEKKTTLKVTGMDCQGCVSKLKRSLDKLGGVKNTQVSLAKKEAVVTYDSAKVKPEQLIAAASDAGFKAEEAPAKKAD